VIEYLAERAGIAKADVPVITADADAQYSDEITIDLNNLVPQISVPHEPHNVHDVADVVGRRIDTVFIGSCTNGRFEDFEEVAKILRGKKIHKDVTLKMTPATKQVYHELLHSPIFMELFEAGALISNPGCGGCAQGHIGLTGKGEVQLSTSNRNFKGKQGAGETYLVGPRIAAASALTGVITLP